MTTINLLPWRYLQRKRAKKNLIIWLITSCLIAMVVVLAGNYQIIKCQKNQRVRNTLLEEEIRLLDKQVKRVAQLKKTRHDLLMQRQMINKWAFSGSLTVHLLNELTRITPSGVVLTKLQRKNQAVTLWGYAHLNADISALMRKAGKNIFMHAPKLTEIKKLLNIRKSQEHAFSIDFLMMPEPSRANK